MPPTTRLLTVATWNVAGLTTAKVPDIRRFLDCHKVDVLCVQELRWGPLRTPIHIHGYNAITQPRTNRGGGVALYVRASLPHQPLRALSTTGPSEEVYARLVLGRDQVIVGSCYLPPPAQVSPGLFVPCLQQRLSTIIGGEFNSHHK